MQLLGADEDIINLDALRRIVEGFSHRHREENFAHLCEGLEDDDISALLEILHQCLEGLSEDCSRKLYRWFRIISRERGLLPRQLCLGDSINWKDRTNSIGSGNGSFGDVYQVSYGNECVAMKVLKPKKGLDEDMKVSYLIVDEITGMRVFSLRTFTARYCTWQRSSIRISLNF